jgi:hypothetical protein
MRIFEIILLCLAVIGIGWSFSLVPGGEALLFIVINLLAVLYFGFGFMFFSNVGFRSAFKGGLKNVPGTTFVIAIFTGLAVSTLTIGILFGILMMPGADNILTIGSVEAVIMLIVNLIYYFKVKQGASKRCISRLAMFSIPSLVLLLTPPLELVKLQYRNHPAYVDAYAKHLEDPRNPEKWELVDLERNRIDLSPEEFELYKKSRAN